MSVALETVQYSQGRLKIVDQLLLPHSVKYVDIRNVQDGWQAIHDMQVCPVNYLT